MPKVIEIGRQSIIQGVVQPMTSTAKLELVFRRCSPDEAARTAMYSGLPNGHERVDKGLGRDVSDPDKWVSINPRFTGRYQPRGADQDMYNATVIFEVAPGTIESLQQMKVSGDIKRGPRGAYGIPPDHIAWFNERVVSVNTYVGVGDTRIKLVPAGQIDVLVDNEGKHSYFVAFPPELLTFRGNSINFNDNLNLERTTWLKTSLMWTLWHSDFGMKEGMQRVLQVTLPSSYTNFLVQSAYSSKESRDKDEIIYQRDPDRHPYKKHNITEPTLEFRRSASTVHFGISGYQLLEFVTEHSVNNIKEVTGAARSVLANIATTAETFTAAVYEELGLRKVKYPSRKSDPQTPV